MMDDPQSSTRKIIENWQQPSENSMVVANHGTLDVPLGGAIVGIIPGVLIGGRIGMSNGNAAILALAGVLAGAIFFGLLGLLVGLTGQWLVSMLKLNRLARPSAGAHLRYSGLVGLLGGAVVHLLLSIFSVEIGGVFLTLFLGAIGWMFCGVVGGIIRMVSERWRK